MRAPTTIDAKTNLTRFDREIKKKTSKANSRSRKKRKSNSSRSRPRKTNVFIYLDIDGVLVPFGGTDDDDDTSAAQRDGCVRFQESSLAALASILKAFPCAQIVLSSTWRCDPTAVRLILSEFKRSGYTTLAAITQLKLTTDPARHDIRQHEIVRHVQAIEASSKSTRVCWVALDDDESVKSDREYASIAASRTVQTESSRGLTAEDAAEAIRILRKQLGSLGDAPTPAKARGVSRRRPS